MCAVERGGGYKIQIRKEITFRHCLCHPLISILLFIQPTDFLSITCQTQREFVLDLKKKIYFISKNHFYHFGGGVCYKFFKKFFC
jgi:hypothetical protein